MKAPLVMAAMKEYFRAAYQKKATDIYFSVGSPPLLKIEGTLRPFPRKKNLDKAKIRKLAMELLSTEKWAEFLSRDELSFTHTLAGVGRLRIILLNGRNGPFMACRLLPQSVPEFDRLGLPSGLKEMVSAGTGLILIIGRARSGKSTTLASLIQHINGISEKTVVTFERSPEYPFAHGRSLIERICAPEHKWSGKDALGAFLHSVDVMVIDGLPLEETIQSALTAAAEGLLVMATIETNGGLAEILARIIYTASAEEREYRRMLLARVLRCAIWQHLLPLKDASGFVPAVEFLINDPVITRLISREGSLHLLRPTMAAGQIKGMQTMRQAIQTLKQKSEANEKILSDFETELPQYYISPLKTRF